MWESVSRSKTIWPACVWHCHRRPRCRSTAMSGVTVPKRNTHVVQLSHAQLTYIMTSQFLFPLDPQSRTIGSRSRTTRRILSGSRSQSELMSMNNRESPMSPVADVMTDSLSTPVLLVRFPIIEDVHTLQLEWLSLTREDQAENDFIYRVCRAAVTVIVSRCSSYVCHIYRLVLQIIHLQYVMSVNTTERSPIAADTIWA